MNVRAVMNPNVKHAFTEASVADIAWIMEKNECGVVPIVNPENRLVGIVTDRDICLAVARRPIPAAAIPVSEVMTKKVYACGPEEELPAALQTMKNKKVRRLPVLDGDGKLVGILSMDDIVLHAEDGKAEKTPALGYGQAIRALKAIYKRPGLKKPLLVAP